MLWGDDSSLKILGDCYDVVWLVVYWSIEQVYGYFVRGVEEVGSGTRFAMLHLKGRHYEPAYFEDKCIFQEEELPRVVLDKWGRCLEELQGYSRVSKCP